MIRARNLDPELRAWIMNQIGPGIGEVHYLAGATGNYYDWLQNNQGVDPAYIHHTVDIAYGALTSARNDVILMTPELFAATPAQTWSKSNCHIIGMSPPVSSYNPAYFTHTDDQDVWWTISGSNNSFHNVRFQHGGGSTTNAHCMEMTGSQNSFYNCHFDGPESSQEAGVAGYDLVKISQEQQLFVGCTFGNPWNPMTQMSALVGFTGNTNPNSQFKNCIFQKNFGAAGALYLHTYQSLNGGTHIAFENCIFQNLGTTTGTYAIDGYGLNTNNAMMSFNGCSFAGVTDVVASTYEAYVWFSNNGAYAASAVQNGLAVNPDVT